MNDNPEPDTSQGFLFDRLAWLNVVVTYNEEGWWDICLRIDGSYNSKQDAEGIAEMFKKDLRRIKDLPQEDRRWRDWGGPEL